MAKGKQAPKSMRRPKDISKSDWDRMSMKQKMHQLMKSGDNEAYRMMSRGAGRMEHAKAVESRAGEAKKVEKNMRGMAQKVSDPNVRAELGGRRIMRYNKNAMSAGRMKEGKRVMMAGSDEALKALRNSIQDALKFVKSETAKNAARKINRLK